MSVCLRKFTKSWLLAISLLLFFAGIIVAPSTLYPQTRTAENSGAVTADQQKQLTRLEQLNCCGNHE